MFRGSTLAGKAWGIKKSDFTVGGERLTDDEFDRLQEEEPGTVIVLHMLSPDENPKTRRRLNDRSYFPVVQLLQMVACGRRHKVIFCPKTRGHCH